MKKKNKIILDAICIGSFLLAVLGCENADGTPNFAWIVPMLAVSGLSGGWIKFRERKANKHRD